MNDLLALLQWIFTAVVAPSAIGAAIAGVAAWYFELPWLPQLALGLAAAFIVSAVVVFVLERIRERFEKMDNAQRGQLLSGTRPPADSSDMPEVLWSLLQRAIESGKSITRKSAATTWRNKFLAQLGIMDQYPAAGRLAKSFRNLIREIDEKKLKNPAQWKTPAQMKSALGWLDAMCGVDLRILETEAKTEASEESNTAHLPDIAVASATMSIDPAAPISLAGGTQYEMDNVKFTIALDVTPRMSVTAVLSKITGSIVRRKTLRSGSAVVLKGAKLIDAIPPESASDLDDRIRFGQARRLVFKMGCDMNRDRDEQIAQIDLRLVIPFEEIPKSVVEITVPMLPTYLDRSEWSHMWGSRVVKRIAHAGELTS